MEASGPDLRDLIGVLRRRWPIIALPAIVGTVIAVATALILPSTFEARARILIESQSIPEDLARSTVTGGPTERISLIEQRLLARETLLEIAQAFSLFADRGQLPPSEIVELMRESIRIDTVVLASAGRGEVTASAVDIVFVSDGAVTAARVANDLLNRVLEQNLEQRSRRAAGTLSFFDAEVGRLGNELTAIEAEIAEFKALNKDSLPDTLNFRLEEAAALEERMFEREARRAAIDEELRVLNAPLAAPLALPAGARADPDLVEILRLRQGLEQQRAIYAETHPAIRGLVARLARLEVAYAARAGAAYGAPAGDAGAAPGAEAESDVAAPPPGPPPENAARAAALARERELLDAQRVVDEERLAALRASIQRTPEVEIALGRLTRGRDGVAQQYRETVLKRAEAATGERLEVSQQAERLEVIEQPVTPSSPSSPNRPLIVAAGAAGGLGLGFGVALLLELAFPYLRTGRDVERRLGARPFVTIPYLETARGRFWRRTRMLAAVLVVLGSAPAALWVIDRYYMPVTTLAERAARMTGVERLIDLARARFAS